ncbi:MAG: hypothetical protein AB7S81_01750 [Bdellovibrionales bacterium]
MFDKFITFIADSVKKRSVASGKSSHFKYVQQALTQGSEVRTTTGRTTWIHVNAPTTITVERSLPDAPKQMETVTVAEQGRAVWKSTICWNNGTDKKTEFTSFEVQRPPSDGISFRIPQNELT